VPLVTFRPSMIGLSADLRQYPLMLMFTSAGANLLEQAFARNSPGMMLLSSGSLRLAMLSDYSGFLFAASVGIYAVFRMFARQPSTGVVVAWTAGQVAGLGLAWFLYTRHIKRLAAGYPGAQNLRHVADWYLRQFYYHPRAGSLVAVPPPSHIRFVIVSKALSLKFIPSGTIRKFQPHR
jgi:hypothetical protein